MEEIIFKIHNISFLLYNIFVPIYVQYINIPMYAIFGVGSQTIFTNAQGWGLRQVAL